MASSYLPDLYPTELSGLDRFSPEDRRLIERALAFAREAHEGQNRIAGPPFVTHLIATAQLLKDQFDADAQAIAAGLLHDAPEDVNITLEEIEEEFGETIRFIVDGVTEVGRGDGNDPVPDKLLMKKLTREKVRAYGEKDERVFHVKIADRWHNLFTCGVLRKKFQSKLATEALHFHAPLCEEIGFTNQAALFKQLAREIVARVGEAERF